MSIYGTRDAEARAARRRDVEAVYDSRADDVSGWLAFAGVLLLVGGSMNVIQGIAAISGSRFFVHHTHYVFASLNTWGWVVLCVGAAQFVIGLGVMKRNQLARWAGIGILSIAALAQLLMAPAYPGWAVLLFAIEVLAIYALAVHGGRAIEGGGS